MKGVQPEVLVNGVDACRVECIPFRGSILIGFAVFSHIVESPIRGLWVIENFVEDFSGIEQPRRSTPVVLLKLGDPLRQFIVKVFQHHL